MISRVSLISPTMTVAHVRRLPQIDLAATLAAPNPQIDLKIAVYETSSRNFIKAVASYKNRAMANISERRAAQVAEKKRIAEKIQAIEAENNMCKIREIDLIAGISLGLLFVFELNDYSDLEREKEERKNAELSVAAFKRQLAKLRDNGQSIEREIEQYRAVTTNLGKGVLLWWPCY